MAGAASLSNQRIQATGGVNDAPTGLLISADGSFRLSDAADSDGVLIDELIN